MSDPIMTRAKRDAELALEDEFSAIASMMSQAQSGAAMATTQVRRAEEVGVSELWQDFTNESYQVRSAATAANMGRSGMAFSGVSGLQREKSRGSARIRGDAASKISDIAVQLQAVASEAGRSKQSVARKKTLLIGQLSDKYRDEAQQRALAERDLAIRERAAADQIAQNKWTREQAAKQETLENTFDEKAYLSGVQLDVRNQILERLNAGMPVDSKFRSTLWNTYKNDPYLSQASKDALFSSIMGYDPNYKEAGRVSPYQGAQYGGGAPSRSTKTSGPTSVPYVSYDLMNVGPLKFGTNLTSMAVENTWRGIQNLWSQLSYGGS